jgi:hypothetical protein
LPPLPKREGEIIRKILFDLSPLSPLPKREGNQKDLKCNVFFYSSPSPAEGGGINKENSVSTSPLCPLSQRERGIRKRSKML